MLEFKVGQKIKLYGTIYTYVGWDSDYSMFANMKPKSDIEAKVSILTNGEIEELIQEGDFVILK